MPLRSLNGYINGHLYELKVGKLINSVRSRNEYYKLKFLYETSDPHNYNNLQLLYSPFSLRNGQLVRAEATIRTKILEPFMNYLVFHHHYYKEDIDVINWIRDGF